MSDKAPKPTDRLGNFLFLLAIVCIPLFAILWKALP
jgi:hypothetical protein